MTILWKTFSDTMPRFRNMRLTNNFFTSKPVPKWSMVLSKGTPMFVITTRFFVYERKSCHLVADNLAKQQTKLLGFSSFSHLTITNMDLGISITSEETETDCSELRWFLFHDLLKDPLLFDCTSHYYITLHSFSAFSS